METAFSTLMIMCTKVFSPTCLEIKSATFVIGGISISAYSVHMFFSHHFFMGQSFCFLIAGRCSPCTYLFILWCDFFASKLVMQSGRELRQDSRITIRITEDGTCVLEISHLYPEDSGEYVVKASNQAGEATSIAHLTVTRESIYPGIMYVHEESRNCLFCQFLAFVLVMLL